MHTASLDLSWLSWKGSCFGHIFPEWWVCISHLYLEVKKCSNVASSAGRDFPNTLTFNSDLLLFVLNSQLLPSCFELLCMSNVSHTFCKHSKHRLLFLRSWQAWYQEMYIDVHMASSARPVVAAFLTRWRLSGPQGQFSRAHRGWGSGVLTQDRWAGRGSVKA